MPELTLDRAMLQGVLQKKLVKPSWRRPVVMYLVGAYRVRRAASVSAGCTTRGRRTGTTASAIR
jgi:hypothetical protein